MKMIIDTDPGVDDALAIALAHAWPEVELLGLTAIFGNTFVDQSSRNARYLLDMLGAEAPVAEGAALPYGATDYTPSANVHGAEGFGDIAEIPQIGTNTELDAADFLIAATKAHPGEVVICAIGPLTNIADAIQRDPGFAGRVGRLVIMGGAFEVPGNITPQAEANIWHDPAAADLVFASGIRCEMVGLNATMQTLLTPDDLDRMAQAAPKIGGFIKRIHDFYLGFYRSVGVMDGCPMHDATAVLACVAPERFTWHETGLAVTQDGDAMGATVADSARPKSAVAMGVEAQWAVDQVHRMMATLD